MLSITRALKAKAPLARSAVQSMAVPARFSNTRLYSSHKEINFGIEGRAKLLKGVEILAKAVAVTLGPKGRHVLIAQPYGTPKITKVCVQAFFFLYIFFLIFSLTDLICSSIVFLNFP